MAPPHPFALLVESETLKHAVSCNFGCGLATVGVRWTVS